MADHLIGDPMGGDFNGFQRLESLT
jgi:hypothetical protein